MIAIIAILAAILFPVFSQAREKARQATCLSNLKNIGTAANMYTQDYDEGVLPMWTQDMGSAECAQVAIKACRNWWMWLAQPYIRNIDMFEDPSTTAGWRGLAVWGDLGSGRGSWALCSPYPWSHDIRRFWGVTATTGRTSRPFGATILGSRVTEASWATGPGYLSWKTLPRPFGSWTATATASS